MITGLRQTRHMLVSFCAISMPVGTTIQQLKTNPVIVLELGNLIYVFLVNDK